ncbi:MAG: aspartate aminotransferase family protein [Phenylobacterium sp.]
MSDGLLERRNRAFGTGAALFYETPLHIVRGEGAWLYDAAGRRYVDMYNNVPCVGHGNPAVAGAIGRQQATLNVHSRYLHEDIIRLAERVASLHGDFAESVIFSCSGTEANEIALRMARMATGRRGIVCTDATYHGNTDLVGAMSGLPAGSDRARGFRSFPFPQTFRTPEPGLSGEALTEAYLAGLDKAMDALEAAGDGVAAMIVCSILANEGLPDIPPGFMTRAAERVRARDGLVIADEVQSGYGRTGRWWGYEVTGFTPDIVVTGKPMGNGVPLAATTASRSLVETFRSRTRYFNTFASSPLQAAAGNAVLDEIEGRGLLANAERVGVFLKAELKARVGRWPGVADARGCGLFLGVEMVGPDGAPDLASARAVCNGLKDLGFLTSNAGAFNNVVKIRPPLVFSQADAEAFLPAFDATLDALHGAG